MTLLEVTITFFFVALLMGLLANLLQSYMRARNRGVDQDNRVRLLQNVDATLLREMREAANVTRVTPDVALTKLDPSQPTTHLPAVFPSGAAPKPAWNPDQSLINVDYSLDRVAHNLLRTATIAGQTSQTVVATAVLNFTTVQTGHLYVFHLTVGSSTNNPEDVAFRVYRSGR